MSRKKEKQAQNASAETDPNEDEAAGEVVVAETAEDPEAPSEEALTPDEPIGDEEVEVVSAAPEAVLQDDAELRAAIEALLFTSPGPLSAKKLAGALGNIEPSRVRQGIKALSESYDGERRGLQILEVAGGFQMATRERFSEFILRLGTKKKPPSLTGATMETLAIIAYRQPITRAAVETIRGVESSGTIRNLLDLEMVAITGRKEVVGRPPLYGTTDKFLSVFGLRSLKDLPSIRGLKERIAEEKAREEAQEAEKPAESTDPEDSAPPHDGGEVAPEEPSNDRPEEAGAESPGEQVAISDAEQPER